MPPDDGGGTAASSELFYMSCELSESVRVYASALAATHGGALPATQARERHAGAGTMRRELLLEAHTRSAGGAGASAHDVDAALSACDGLAAAAALSARTHATPWEHSASGGTNGGGTAGAPQRLVGSEHAGPYLASWNEWLPQGVKYRDLPSDAEVVFTLRDAAAAADLPPLAAARLPLFTRDGLLREGWFTVAMEPLAAKGAAAPGSAHAGRAPDGNGLSASCGLAQAPGSEAARVERLVRRYERGAVAHVPWLDSLTFGALAEANTHAMRREADEAELAVVGGSTDDGGASHPTLSLLVELPRFTHRVVWDEREDQEVLVHGASTAALGVAAGVLTTTCSAVGAVVDPEISRESPAELKQIKLARGLTRMVLDTAAKPDSSQRRAIDRVLRKPPSAPLSTGERQMLWRFRHSLQSDPAALSKFLRVVDWGDAAERRQAVALLHDWAPLAPAAALELLSADFTAMPEAREHAVQALDAADDEELLSYLLPLVHALRYEREQESALARFLVRRSSQSFVLANFLHWYLFVEFEDKVYATRFHAVHEAFIDALKGVQGEDAWECICQQSQLLAQLGAVSKSLKVVGSNVKKKERLHAMLDATGDFSELARFETPLPLPHDPRVLVAGVVPAECSVFKSALSPLRVTFLRAGITDAEMQRAGYVGAGGVQDGHARAETAEDGDGEAREDGADPSPPPPVPRVTCIYKREDDLRQDQLVIQMIRLMDKLLKAENLDLRLTLYSVVATSRDEGLLEFVPSRNFSHVLAEYKNVLSFFRACAPDPSGPHGCAHRVIDTYVRSCAGYCVITYILGVGDRHLDNLMLTPEGSLFHIDFGYILGKDPKPFPPPMKLNKEMVEGMGGIKDEWFSAFKNYCVEAYNILRRHGNLVLNLFHLMAGANIPNIASDPEKVLLQLQEKFRMDLDDEAAVQFFQELIVESMSGLFPSFFEATHKVAQAFRS